MTARRRPFHLARSRPPRRTVRLRLTLLYGGVLIASGAVLLGVTYLLVRQGSGDVRFKAQRTTGGAVVNGPHGVVRLIAPANPTASSRVSPNGPNLVVRSGSKPPVVLLPVPGPLGYAPSPHGPIAEAVEQAQTQASQLKVLATQQHNDELHTLLIDLGIALAIVAVVSLGLGWIVAGRVLAPLHTITKKTRAISATSLHRRLALRGPDDELKELGDTIDGLLARLEAAFEAQRRFVANASHELRTPLTMMRTSLDVATGKPQPIPPEVTALAAKLRQGLDQAERLLESFLTLARAQDGALPEQTEVALRGLVSEAIAARARAIAEKELDVSAELPDLRVLGSETLLARLAGNLIDNAVRHNERAGWVRVGAAEEDGEIRLVVENGGERLEEGRVRELAVPFRRLGADRTGSADGFGLGLSIVAAIAAAHGGSLELEAPQEGGLRAIVTLPDGGGRREAAGASGALAGVEVAA